MDVSSPCGGGAGSSPAPWMAGRLARPWDLIHAHLHTLQSKRGKKTRPCFPLGSQPQMQRGRGSTAPTLNTHPAPCPVADKPYTSQHPPAPGSVPRPPAPQGTALPLAKGPRGWIKCKISLWICPPCVGVVGWGHSPPAAGAKPTTSQPEALFSQGSGNLAAPQAIATSSFYF